MIEEIARQVIGKPLKNAAGIFHVYEGCESPEPLALWLEFDDGHVYRFAGASDGWHIIVDRAAAQEVDMQGSGSIRFHDLSTKSKLSPVLNQLVRRVWLISSPDPQDVIGVRIDFETSTVRILNWGDELRVARDFPEDADLGSIHEIAVEGHPS